MAGCGVRIPLGCTPRRTSQETELTEMASDPNKDVLMLHIGKKKEGQEKLNHLLLEMCTPKGKDYSKPKPRKDTRDSQWDDADCIAAGGSATKDPMLGGKGKGGRGKRGSNDSGSSWGSGASGDGKHGKKGGKGGKGGVGGKSSKDKDGGGYGFGGGHFIGEPKPKPEIHAQKLTICSFVSNISCESDDNYSVCPSTEQCYSSESDYCKPMPASCRMWTY